MPDFLMPSLGADMVGATLIEWKVKAGDTVKRGDIIAEIETEKGDIDVEVYEDGVVEKIVAQPGDKLPVGALLAVISYAGETPAMAPAAEPAARPAAPAPEAVPLAPPPAAGGRLRASPLARRIARELGLELREIRGSGPFGAIKRADVEAAASHRGTTTPLPAPEPVAEAQKTVTTPAPIPPAAAEKAGFAERMRSAIAAAMAKSNREIPHYYLETQIDMRQAHAWLEATNRERSVKERLLPAVLPLKAVALALADVPELNGFWLDERHQPQEGIHIGFAIALRQGGLLTPAIHHVDLLSLEQLMAHLADLSLRARQGKLRLSEMTDATVTLTSLGDRGVEKVFGVIYPPQLACVGLGKVMEKPWAENGALSVRPVMTATLAGDHRATDGRTGARFLEALNEHLQHPEGLDRTSA